jgi:hypothetical protein
MTLPYAVPSRPDMRPASLAARFGLFLACLPSGSAVLTEVYGVASLHDVVWYLAVPGYLILAATWWVTRNSPEAWVRELADAIAIGVVGGFLATVAYDVVRIPFVMSGYRVYVPNSTYGLWIVGSDASTRLSETIGWAYHFANGITFGVMYALFMRGRHWFWAIVWACLLETIAMLTPYAVVYQLAGKPLVIAIAYFGHVAYGLPLGFMTQRWEGSARYLRTLPPIARGASALLLFAAVAGSLTAPSPGGTDVAKRPNTFQVDEGRILPDWLHLTRSGAIVLRNSCAGPNVVVWNGAEQPPLAPCEEREIVLAERGIHQFYARSSSFRSHSSFVLVDPVAQAEVRKP